MFKYYDENDLPCKNHTRFMLVFVFTLLFLLKLHLKFTLHFQALSFDLQA